MPGVLMDSHVLYNFALGKPQLGPETIDLLNGARRLMFSSISVFELTIKHLLGKFEDIEPLVSALKKSGVMEVPLDSASALRLKEFPALSNHDPFDRGLLAQALEIGADFVTADRKILSLGLEWVKDARK